MRGRARGTRVEVMRMGGATARVEVMRVGWRGARVEVIHCLCSNNLRQ